MGKFKKRRKLGENTKSTENEENGENVENEENDAESEKSENAKYFEIAVSGISKLVTQDSSPFKVVEYRKGKSSPVLLASGSRPIPVPSLLKKISDYPSIPTSLRAALAVLGPWEAATAAIQALDDSVPTSSEFQQRDSDPESIRGRMEKNLATSPEMQDLTLNVDLVDKSRDVTFFLTTPKEYLSDISGRVFLKKAGIDEVEALSIARKVVPTYSPRKGPGVFTQTSHTGEELNYFNTYVPPKWLAKKPIHPDRLPPLFSKLVRHLFPIKEEREYFFSWLYHSLFRRSFVYLVLCGAPGSGKNRLKLVLRALHGHHNTVDGKKSTFSERFNSQLENSTLAWFDELRYSEDQENTMKEVQNDTISIERKGIDATRATKIYASMVISNNKPRDNYITFDSRKFVPLRIRNASLLESMTDSEISELTGKVEDPNSPRYDLEFIRQIGYWIYHYGKSKKWPNLEYRGPMFYRLCHTSMTRWQKRAVLLLLEKSSRADQAFDDSDSGSLADGGSMLWSELEEKYLRRSSGSTQFPDYSSIKHFFDIFVDGAGQKTFETKAVKGSILGDFYVRVMNKNAQILTDTDDLLERSGNGDTDHQSRNNSKEHGASNVGRRRISGSAKKEKEKIQTRKSKNRPEL